MQFTLQAVTLKAKGGSPNSIRGGKDKVNPLQAWKGPEGSRRLRLPDFKTSHEGGKVISPMHRPPLPAGNIPGTHFC